MYCIIHIGILETDANLCAQKNLKRASPDFDPVTSMTCDAIKNTW